MGGVHPSDCLGMRRSSRGLVLAAAALGSILFAPAAMAQDAAPVPNEALGNLCQVYSIDSAVEGAKELRAHCRGRGLMLGPVTTFETIENPELRATLVDLRRGPDRHVLLLTIQDEGAPLVEDLTGQIALAAGRGPMSQIDGVELDFKAFARTGEVGVRGRPEDTGRDRAGMINLAQQVSAERARKGAERQN